MERPADARVMQPPLRVWIKVGKLLKHGFDDFRERAGRGVRVEPEAPGMLLEWMPRSDGGWLGLVTYELITTDEKWSRSVTHYVPAHLIRRRGMTRREQLRDERRTHG
ncbi:hypothetical protein FPZ12_004765 [Amycolatopsis acidicola]|uniref:Uncharacterized protein n=1 Tax=Amycolatopsis acidicola TaxID=2596893 RepID=A0A5N0VHH5_9PSEU|nr:hypothetical protein [Amycolatopsis acidicola]KAA9165799.1 hypothetical protein FPZ12_004765 [Amycolatopsis acidicola]